MKTLTRSRSALLAILFAALTAAEGCQAVAGIFKAGFWVGIVLAVVVVGVVLAEAALARGAHAAGARRARAFRSALDGAADTGAVGVAAVDEQVC
jgi:hypothetical protein